MHTHNGHLYFYLRVCYSSCIALLEIRLDAGQTILMSVSAARASTLFAVSFSIASHGTTRCNPQPRARWPSSVNTKMGWRRRSGTCCNAAVQWQPGSRSGHDTQSSALGWKCPNHRSCIRSCKALLRDKLPLLCLILFIDK